MHRSSSSIGGLAAALANAQAELVNPEKSLIGSIYSNASGAKERLFRYAPLSAGLDIVRKTLSQHEIAVVQTTAIDQATGLVNLTTVLAHTSGEWIASDWPVCGVSEIATPHRMGAALTYARRYALFTLVGIAGEDDLDAPDLATPTSWTSAPAKSKEESSGSLNGGGGRSLSQQPARRREAKLDASRTTAILDPAASAELCGRLLAEIGELGSGDEAAVWARQSLQTKNGLTAANGRAVEEAFAAKLALFARRAADGLPIFEPKQPRKAQRRDQDATEKRRRSAKIDKTLLQQPEPRRVRDREHVKTVAKHPCLICGRLPADAHHLRFAQSRALGRKVSDEFTVPLCRGHHREVHGLGDEPAWWRNKGVDPMISARELWLVSHPLQGPENQGAEALNTAYSRSCG